MSRKERRRELECQYCRFFGRCEVHWGIECNRQGGKRVPRFRSFDWGQLQEA